MSRTGRLHAGSIVCTVENLAPRLTTTITLDGSELAVCCSLNDDQPGHLTLVKEVDNGTTGATARRTDWTLSASGPTPISGASGSVSGDGRRGQRRHLHARRVRRPDRVPGVVVVVHRCPHRAVPRSRSRPVVTSPAPITDTAIAPRLTLVKQVENGTTGGTATPLDWTLSATGPTTISGQSGRCP